ncbi:MAG: glycosyltransferase family 2 protein [Anaeromyxobacteraceae bacterium]
MRLAVDIGLVLLSLPVLVASCYLLLLTLLSGRRPPPVPVAPRLRFDVVVPAHDEEVGIGRTVRSLLSIDYPAPLRRVVVVADNCKDATADRAQEAGATVLVRTDDRRRGKGYALDHAFSWSLQEGYADAVVVIDADSDVDPGLLRAFATRLEAGEVAVQADNAVGNPEASWRTCLLAIAFVLVDTVRMLGRERLRCSAGLRGNGMCLSASVLREVPHHAFSVVEDLEYGIRLGLAGHRVAYANDARVRSEMAVSVAASGTQRQRWEGGRRAMAARYALPLIAEGLRRPDRVLLDLGMDLAVPPLAYLAGATLGGAALSGLWAGLLGGSPVVVWPWGMSVAAIALYVLRGWQVSGTGLAGLRALLHAPGYLAWKVGLRLRARRNGEAKWIRTERERGP